MQQLLVKTRLADKDIVGRRVLALDSENGKAAMAQANTESLVGVATPLAVKKGKPRGLPRRRRGRGRSRRKNCLWQPLDERQKRARRRYTESQRTPNRRRSGQ